MSSHTATSSSRKRPRSSSPNPQQQQPTIRIRLPPAMPTNPSLATMLVSRDETKVVSALNSLLLASADHDANWALGEGGDMVVRGLVNVFDACVGWTGEDGGDVGGETSKAGVGPKGEDYLDRDYSDLTPSASTWFTDSRTVQGSWSSFCQITLGCSSSALSEADTRIVNVLLMILRNLSYVAGNHRILVHSTGTLRILTGCLHYRPSPYSRSFAGASAGREEEGSSGSGSLSLHAIHTLINLVAHVDVTGRKVFADRMLLDPSLRVENKTVVPSSDSSSHGKASFRYGHANDLGFGGMLIAKRYDNREENLAKVPPVIVWEVAADNIRATLALFPALASALDCCTVANGLDDALPLPPQPPQQRSVVVSALELCKELLDNTDNHAIFIHVPDDFLARLVALLWVPRLGPDSLEYVDPISNVVSRVSTLKLLNGYDATIDFELRDRSVEILVQLTGLSPDIKKRLGRRCGQPRGVGGADRTVDWSRQHNARLYESLIPMIGTTVGRNDAPVLAGRLLANMVMVPENAAGIAYLEGRLVDVSSRDAHVANAACNGVLNKIG